MLAIALFGLVTGGALFWYKLVEPLNQFLERSYDEDHPDWMIGSLEVQRMNHSGRSDHSSMRAA